MDRLAKKNEFLTYTFDTPIGTSTLNSVQSAVVPEIDGAEEVIICVSSSDTTQQIHFVKSSAISAYIEYKYIRPNSSDYSYSYDVRWTPASNTIGIRFNFKGSSASTPKIYHVMYR